MLDTAALPTPTNNKRTTVKFNVGGKIFEISRSLLDSFPDTMIYKAASETWVQKNNDNNPIFIERNCDRFQYVLDYMRDGHCSLPYHTTKDAMLNELSYFGFDVVDPDKIAVQYSPSLATNIVASYYQKHPVLIQNLDLEKQFTNLAFYCFDHYIKKARVEKSGFTSDELLKYGSFVTHRNKDKWAASKGPSEAFQNNILLKKCAAEFGLEYISILVYKNNFRSIKFGFSKDFKR